MKYFHFPSLHLLIIIWFFKTEVKRICFQSKKSGIGKLTGLSAAVAFSSSLSTPPSPGHIISGILLYSRIINVLSRQSNSSWEEKGSGGGSLSHFHSGLEFPTSCSLLLSREKKPGHKSAFLGFWVDKALPLKKLDKKLKLKREKTPNLSMLCPHTKTSDQQQQLLPKIPTIPLAIILNHKTSSKNLWKRNTCII